MADSTCRPTSVIVIRSDMMECSLCRSALKKPKCFPCLHTFCLECLEEYVDKNDSPDELPCPLCREMFTIPAQGVSGLRDNFFIVSLIESSVISETKDSEYNSFEMMCEMCQEGNDASISPVAQSYCKDCTQHMCTTCADIHGKLKGTRSHAIVQLSAASTFNPPRFCDKHKNDSLRLYCITCEVPVCIVCFAVEHQGHQCEEIQDTAAKLRGQFQSHILQLNESTADFNVIIEQLKSIEGNVRKQSNESELNIREKCNEIRRIIDLYEEELLVESRQHMNEILEKTASHMSVIEDLNAKIEFLKVNLETIYETGSPSDVAYNGEQLLERAEVLMEASRESVLKQTPAVKHVEFIPYLGEVFGKSRIGQICMGERILLTLGLNKTDTTMDQKICEISLEKRDTINVINSTPAKIKAGSAACVVSNVLYAVGLGGARNQLWAWSASRDDSFNDKKKQPWTRCADMTSGRRGHCVTSVGDKIYVLGGWVYAGEKTLDSILCYDINSNKWSEAGKLNHALMSAACVTYKHCIYVFSGGDRDTGIENRVQIYDTTTRNVALSSNPIPAEYDLMKAVLWKTTAIHIGRDTCYLYDFEFDTWQERSRFKTDVVHFGLTLDDNTLYITGGGICSDAGVWTRRADVKSLLVDDFISDNRKAEWKHHATLPTPANIQAYSPVSMIK